MKVYLVFLFSSEPEIPDILVKIFKNQEDANRLVEEFNSKHEGKSYFIIEREVE